MSVRYMTLDPHLTASATAYAAFMADVTVGPAPDTTATYCPALTMLGVDFSRPLTITGALPIATCCQCTCRSIPLDTSIGNPVQSSALSFSCGKSPCASIMPTAVSLDTPNVSRPSSSSAIHSTESPLMTSCRIQKSGQPSRMVNSRGHGTPSLSTMQLTLQSPTKSQ